MKCLGCGAVKDMLAYEVYPYPEDDRLCTKPIPPLFVLECEPKLKGSWRIVIVCHECFKKLDPDMWIGERCWEGINPVVPFGQLPLNNLQPPMKWKPENYKEAS